MCFVISELVHSTKEELLDQKRIRVEGELVSSRKWRRWDKISALYITATHLLALFSPFCFSWAAFWTAVSIAVVTGLIGINLSYHRHLTHKSFKIPKWLEYFFAYLGVLAFQGDPIFWVSNHRFHHQYSDTRKDPHSPVLGFWYSHMCWIFNSGSIKEKIGKRDNVSDLENQAFYRWIRYTYSLHAIGLAILLYAIGGFPYIVYGMVRNLS
ncbi:Palmitoyl-monogalactosyldiacylglycerol delta-7 desaturase, chloroplastic [Linum grandiflorum]